MVYGVKQSRQRIIAEKALFNVFNKLLKVFSNVVIRGTWRDVFLDR
jgi:hypothetical protein